MQRLFTVRGSTKRTRQVADIPLSWGRGAPQKLKKNRNFKIEAEFGGLWGEMFQGFWARAGKCYRGAHWLMCEQNRAGLLSTVPPPEGAERGLSKSLPLPHAQIGGLAPNFYIFPNGDPEPLQIPKIS